MSFNSEKLKEQFHTLIPVYKTIRSLETIADKIDYLRTLFWVQNYLHKSPFIQTCMQELNAEHLMSLLSILTIQQEKYILEPAATLPDKFEKLRLLLKQLIEVEKFYSSLGGLIGYHYHCLSLLIEKNKINSLDNLRYKQPPLIDISHRDSSRKSYSHAFYHNLPSLGAIFVVGGAGERLKFSNQQGEHLPTALYPFQGVSLLTRMMRDIESWEIAYYKKTGNYYHMPLVFMTSHENNNHSHILNYLEQNQWFGREKENFLFLTQPLVPVITENGHWVSPSPLKLSLKPGGHGALWKLALDGNLFDFFEKRNIKKAFIRQVNNPVANTDEGLTRFLGYGLQHDQVFGFAACERLVGSATGMNVCIEQKNSQGQYLYTLSNIEYPLFKKHHLKDCPRSTSSPFSQYPANTNLLFIDLKSLETQARKDPYPGLLLNLKSTISVNGYEYRVGRLESTMQNIADTLSEQQLQALPEKKPLTKTYITYYPQPKTLAAIKNHVSSKQCETVEDCFIHQMYNYRELLTEYCDITLPEQQENAPPSFIAYIHPSLGPSFKTIAKCIYKGSLALHSELFLEIFNLELKNITLKGSLLITSSETSPDLFNKCQLNHLHIDNEGIDMHKSPSIPKGEIIRKECVHITLGKGSQFIAEHITIKGNFQLKVGNFECVTLTQNKQNELLIHRKKLAEQAPAWI